MSFAHPVRMAKSTPVCDHPPVAQNNIDPQHKHFHGWRLLAILAVVILAIAAVSFVVDWLVIGPLEGRIL